MQNFKHQNKQNNVKDKNERSREYAKEYLSKYLTELQRHFDLNDRHIRYILLKVYRELSPFNFFKNWISVVKSEYRRKLKTIIKELKWK